MVTKQRKIGQLPALMKSRTMASLLAGCVFFIFSVTQAAETNMFDEDFDSASPQKLKYYAAHSGQDKNEGMQEVEDGIAGANGKCLHVVCKIREGRWYYYNFPVQVPMSGRIEFSGRMKVVEGRAVLGYAWNRPESGNSGMIVVGTPDKPDANGWQTWRFKISPNASPGAHLERIGLFVYPVSNSTDVEVKTAEMYLDEFKLTTELSADAVVAFKQEIDKFKVELQENNTKKMADVQRREAVVEAAVKARFATPIPAGDIWIRTFLEKWRAHSLSELERIKKLKPEVMRAQYRPALNALRAVDKLSRSYEILCKKGSVPEIIHFRVEPTQNDQILPTSGIIPALALEGLTASACRGEYEPVSFALLSNRDVSRIDILIDDFTGSNGLRLPASMADVRILKAWWQAGYGVAEINSPRLTPELLLHDEDFVRVDREGRKNALKNSEKPQDAPRFTGFSLARHEPGQIWITVRIPNDAVAGEYATAVRVLSDGKELFAIPFHLTVHPFELLPSSLHTWIYYAAKLDETGAIGSELKTESQFRREIADMKAHGIAGATSYAGFKLNKDGTFDFSALERDLFIRKEMGFLSDPVIIMRHPIPFHDFVKAGEAERQKILEEARRIVHATTAWCKERGYPPLIFYCIDEAVGDVMCKQAELCKVVREAGGLTISACGPDLLGDGGNIYDYAIFDTIPTEQLSRQLAGKHIKALLYNNPQAGIENPEIYRRNYGLSLYKWGMQGSCDFAYQYAFGKIYDDFDNSSYRDHVFAYPTIDGVVDTVQFEGFREGIDDLRYLATLQKVIEKAGRESIPAAEAMRFIENFDIEDAPETIRAAMVSHIMSLNAASSNEKH